MDAATHASGAAAGPGGIGGSGIEGFAGGGARQEGGFGKLIDGLAGSLRQRYNRASTEARRVDDNINEQLGSYELANIVKDLHMTEDETSLVRHAFETAVCRDIGRDRMALGAEAFAQVATRLLRAQCHSGDMPASRVKQAVESSWREAGKDKHGFMDFREFLVWYSSNGFAEDLLLTEQESWVRSVAKQHGVKPDYVETIKRCFDVHDDDNSGKVEMAEFKQLLEKVLRVPAGLELPPSRVRHFWSELDTKRTGDGVDFEEFLTWYIKYFGDGTGSPKRSAVRTKEMPFEAFYRQFRRIGAKHLDPPAYPATEEEDETDLQQKVKAPAPGKLAVSAARAREESGLRT